MAGYISTIMLQRQEHDESWGTGGCNRVSIGENCAVRVVGTAADLGLEGDKGRGFAAGWVHLDRSLMLMLELRSLAVLLLLLMPGSSHSCQHALKLCL